MKVVLLAGGFGTRLAEYTDTLPKPMVPIGGKPILWHIMKRYAFFGHRNFFVALGYKAEVIKEYFLNYRTLNADFTVDLASGAVTPHQLDYVDWKVTLIDTGLGSMTGGRVKRMRKYIGNEAFMLTYGDGVSDIDIDSLLAFHKQHGKLVTVTSVRPSARFGELKLEGDKVIDFQEKPRLAEGWINGGYFVIEPDFLDLIEGDSTFLEKEPLEKAAEIGEMVAFRHYGFWQCMDTKRDRDLLEELWKNNNAAWKV
jgi:glucose-1-phosphate cytidylyltransferase